jgi:predicted enzyme related to lactoylglutathione lyase
MTMASSFDQAAGCFCWVDLAASDARQAQAFYGRLFGWMACEDRANGGVFTRLQLGGREVGSVYQLQRAHLERGVPSHWTPYVRVDDVDATTLQTEALGGEVMIPPVVVADMARISIIVDPVGAHLGLWQPLQQPARRNGRG